MLELQKAFSPLKRALPRSIWLPLRGIVTGIVTPLRFAFKTGHWSSSMTMTARTQAGEPLPWYTYPAIDLLSQRNFANRNVLEFGGGQSSRWWAKRAKSVLTIEEDRDWYTRLKSQIGEPNITLVHMAADDRAKSIARIKALLDAHPIKKFDVIIVDGHFREELTTAAFAYLAQGGAIILDDSDGYQFYENTRNLPCRRVDFFGFAPGVSLRRCTSIVYVDDCFLFHPDIPIPEIERTDPARPPQPSRVGGSNLRVQTRS